MKKRVNKASNKKISQKVGTRAGRKTSKNSRLGKKQTKSKLVAKNKGKIKPIAKRGKAKKPKKLFAQYSEGTGDNRTQFTYWFPAGLAEYKKVANLRAWDGSPIEKFIRLNHPVKRKSGRVLNITKNPVDAGTGYREPQAVYIKLVKRKPRGQELYYTSQISPPELRIDKANTQSFAVGVLEKYYSNFIENIREDQKSKKKQRFGMVHSDPDDFEGKPMKVVAVIFHFLY